MNDLDPKKIIDDIHTATEIVKSARGLIKEVVPLMKKIPWRAVARGSAMALRKILEAMREAVRLPEPWPRACLLIKSILTIASYLIFLTCLALLIADCYLFSKTHLSTKQTVAAIAFLIFASWGTAAAFAQAEWLRVLMAKNSRILWGHRPAIQR